MQVVVLVTSLCVCLSLVVLLYNFSVLLMRFVLLCFIL